MGLSDRERLAGVFHAVKDLYRVDRFSGYDSFNDHERFNTLLDSVWSTMLRRSSNGGYWFAGGSLDSNHFSDMSLVSIAFANACAEDRDQIREIIEENSDEEEKERYDWITNFLPTQYKLLKNKDSEAANVLHIFRITEQYFYAANRYDDALAKKLAPLTDIVATLQSLCMYRFSQQRIYADSWMTEQVLEKCLGHLSPNDLVSKWAREEHLHHDIRIHPDHDVLFETFKKWQNRHYKPSSNERLMFLLSIVGDKLHYHHQQTKLFVAICKHNEANESDKFDLEAVSTQLAKIFANHQENEKDIFTRPDYCSFTQQDINKKDNG